MALDFGILQPANISGQLQAGQESAMRNQLAQQQLASGRTEQEMSQMKLSELRRNTAALESMQRKFLENGKSDDMDANYDAMISSGIPHFMDIGIKAKQTLAQTRIDYATMGLPMPSYLQPKGQGAATGAPALNVVSRNEGVPQPVPAASEDRLGDFISQIEAKQNAPMPMPAVTGRPIQPEMAAAPNALAPAAPPQGRLHPCRRLPLSLPAGRAVGGDPPAPGRHASSCSEPPVRTPAPSPPSPPLPLLSSTVTARSASPSAASL
jgi:hypothetical protein